MVETFVFSDNFKNWIICLLVFLFVLYTVFPKIWAAAKNLFYKARYGQDFIEMVKHHEQQLNGDQGIEKKLERDYSRLNSLEAKIKSATEENELIMESLLAIIKSLNKITKTEEAEEIQDKLIDFMNKSSHK